PTPLSLLGNDSELLAATRAWLEGGSLGISAPISLEVVRGEPALAPDDLRPTYRQGDVVIRAGGTATDPVRLDWLAAPATATVTSSPATARLTLSQAACDRLDECLRTFGMTVLIFLLRRQAWHHVHAATAVDPRGRGWLLAGNAHAGKSTTTALLASRGWAVGSDDISFLTTHDSEVLVHAFRSPIAVRHGGVSLLGKGGGEALESRDKTGYWPEELGGRWQAVIRPEIIYFPTVGAERTTVEPLRPVQVLAELVRWSAWVVLEPALAQGHLDLINLLARQGRGYRLTLGRDLFRDPAILDTLVAT
ncbi:MAG TPA: hypothetical protein VMJ30_07035, partial [Gemmatimonadales bacterium]|nr:hypothetical protein [Gemmatimonadales bacterium]